MLKVVIVDDEESCTKELYGFLMRYQKEKGLTMDIECYREGLSFLDGYKADADVVFMDIEMPYMDGLETARRLREKDTTVILVFVTVMAQYAIRGYEVDAMDFMVKPLSYLNFSLKLEKAMRLSQRNRPNVLHLDSQDGIIRMETSEILYVESLAHYCIFHTKDGEFKKYATMKSVEEELKDELFLRCNNSFLINPAYVTKLLRDAVMVNGTEIPISRARKKKFLDALTNYFGNEMFGGK